MHLSIINFGLYSNSILHHTWKFTSSEISMCLRQKTLRRVDYKKMVINFYKENIHSDLISLIPSVIIVIWYTCFWCFYGISTKSYTLKKKVYDKIDEYFLSFYFVTQWYVCFLSLVDWLIFLKFTKCIPSVDHFFLWTNKNYRFWTPTRFLYSINITWVLISNCILELY